MGQLDRGGVVGELLTGEERDAPQLDVGHGRVHDDVAHPGGPDEGRQAEAPGWRLQIGRVSTLRAG